MCATWVWGLSTVVEPQCGRLGLMCVAYETPPRAGLSH